jgi:predicted transporter
MKSRSLAGGDALLAFCLCPLCLYAIALSSALLHQICARKASHFQNAATACTHRAPHHDG